MLLVQGGQAALARTLRALAPLSLSALLLTLVLLFGLQGEQCASGAMLSRGAFTGLLGKLCLTRQSLVMLPYEGAMVEVAIKLAEQLEKKILGPFADMAEKLKKLGLYAKGPEVVKRVLVWPLSTLETNAEVRSHMLGGADLIVTSGGMKYEFNMRGKGHQPAGFASAEDFRDQINRLRLRL